MTLPFRSCRSSAEFCMQIGHVSSSWRWEISLAETCEKLPRTISQLGKQQCTQPWTAALWLLALQRRVWAVVQIPSRHFRGHPHAVQTHGSSPDPVSSRCREQSSAPPASQRKVPVRFRQVPVRMGFESPGDPLSLCFKHVFLSGRISGRFPGAPSV